MTTTPENRGEPDRAADGNASHWTLLRDVVAFQLKLAVDGLRDVLLSPLSIGAAILGIIASPRNPGHYFNELLKVGHRSDRWINLFGAMEHYGEDEFSTDLYIRKAEELIKKEYDKGGVVKSVKESADGLIGKIHLPGKDD